MLVSYYYVLFLEFYLTADSTLNCNYYFSYVRYSILIYWTLVKYKSKLEKLKCICAILNQCSVHCFALITLIWCSHSSWGISFAFQNIKLQVKGRIIERYRPLGRLAAKALEVEIPPVMKRRHRELRGISFFTMRI